MLLVRIMPLLLMLLAKILAVVVNIVGQDSCHFGGDDDGRGLAVVVFVVGQDPCYCC